jgi:hypothetical protein
MPNQVDDVLLHAMDGTELSRVRTALNGLRILAAISPHPIQLNRHPAPHRSLGNALVPAHRQALVATSPVRMDTRRRLGRLHQQEAQQGDDFQTGYQGPLLSIAEGLVGDRLFQLGLF